MIFVILGLVSCARGGAARKVVLAAHELREGAAVLVDGDEVLDLGIKVVVKILALAGADVNDPAGVLERGDALRLDEAGGGRLRAVDAGLGPHEVVARSTFPELLEGEGVDIV